MGTLLIWLAFIMVICAIICTLLHRFTKHKRFRTYAIFSTFACLALVTLSYILLSYYFLISNFDIHYVWYYSSKNSDWYLKLTGVWAGQEGSFLLWVWIILLALGIEELFQYGRQRKCFQYTTNTFDWTRAIVLMVVAVFLILLIIKDPFEPTHIIDFKFIGGGSDTIAPADFPNGKGLDPMLRNIWMLVHPPILFIGYALITVPFAASLSYSITGDRKWTAISLQWSRLAWLFLTLGIGIGAVWAYIAQGWGGYWGWDPVEVASLLPWITLTAFLHIQLRNMRKNEYGTVTPIFGTITFVLVLFATFITRSGLWVSIHAWSETEVGWVLLTAMIGTIIVSALIILRSFLIRNRPNGQETTEVEEENNWDSLTMIATVMIFTIFTLIIVIGLIVTMNKVNPSFYETRLMPFIVVLLMVMSVCLCWRYFGKKNSIVYIACTTVAGIGCAIFLPRFFTGEGGPFYDIFGAGISGHNIVGFLIPFILVVILGAVYRIIMQLKVKTIRNKLKTISPHIIHIGVALIIIGYAGSQTMETGNSEWLQVGDTLEIGEYQIELTGIEIEEDTGENGTAFADQDTWIVTFKVYKNKEFIRKGRLNVILAYYFDNNEKEYYKIENSEVLIDQMPLEDLYISFKGFSDNEFEIEVKKIPMMSLLWSGMWLFITGISIRVIIDCIPKKR